MNVEPRPGSLSTRIVPPWRRTIPYTVARPRPVPRSRSLVVKNGSKILSRVASSIPHPVSATASHTCPPPSSSPPAVAPVEMVSSPPPGMASRALTARFRSTCSSPPRSPSSSNSPGSGRTTISMSSLITRRSILRIPFASSLRSRISGLISWRRLKARSWRVRPAARSAAARISRRWSSVAMPFSRSVSATPAWARITCRTLLKSCATPPASRPTVSIFCACRSCSWRSRSSVSSRM